MLPRLLPAVRGFSSHLDDAVAVLPLPKLSHEMEDGWVAKWRVTEGQRIAEFDVICEVATENLTEAGYRVGAFAGRTVTLLLEAQEEGYVHSLLVQEGQRVPVGRPIAIICDHPGPADHRLSTSNVYDDSQGRVRVVSWQSYLKEGGAGAGQGGGCM
jgi:pyruvate/2-oxoglutarate dehydrogenase complex dihydrolipoamide acyltransferase (E2) component